MFKTTFVTFLLLALAVFSEAKGHVQHRDHLNLNRIVRKRSPQADSGDETSSFASSTSLSATSVTSTGSSASTESSTSTSAIETSILSIISDSISSASSATSSSASPSSFSSSSPLSSTLASTSKTTTARASETSSSIKPTLNIASDADEVSATRSTNTNTVFVDASATNESAQETDTPETTGSAGTSDSATALTAIIAVAASIGVIIVLWTIFRKWKLARSEKFDRRLNPIDWQPTSDLDDPAVPGSHRRGSSDTSSFHSGAHHDAYSAHHGSESGHGHGHGAAPALGPLPDHDFTASAYNSNAGYGDYADLNRGPSLNRTASPQPPMHELARGPSLTRPGYDNAVPLHHQTGYGAPNAYDYNGGNTGRY